jgi:hypothetical protein
LLGQYRLDLDAKFGLTRQHVQLREDSLQGFRRRRRGYNGIDAHLHHVQPSVVERRHFLRIKQKPIGDEHYDILVRPGFDVTNQGHQVRV